MRIFLEITGTKEDNTVKKHYFRETEYGTN